MLGSATLKIESEVVRMFGDKRSNGERRLRPVSWDVEELRVVSASASLHARPDRWPRPSSGRLVLGIRGRCRFTSWCWLQACRLSGQCHRCERQGDQKHTAPRGLVLGCPESAPLSGTGAVRASTRAQTLLATRSLHELSRMHSLSETENVAGKNCAGAADPQPGDVPDEHSTFRASNPGQQSWSCAEASWHSASPRSISEHWANSKKAARASTTGDPRRHTRPSVTRVGLIGASYRSTAPTDSRPGAGDLLGWESLSGALDASETQVATTYALHALGALGDVVAEGFCGSELGASRPSTRRRSAMASASVGMRP